jgi:hypothetical protein
LAGISGDYNLISIARPLNLSEKVKRLYFNMKITTWAIYTPMLSTMPRFRALFAKYPSTFWAFKLGETL